MITTTRTEFRQTTLDNGLSIIGEVSPSAHSAAIGFFVKAGARDEATSLMGVSHFLEHMMFKGTERRAAEQVDLDFDRIGANHNAFTTSEMTAFWAHCLPEHLAEAEGVLSDIMRPSIRPEDFDAEKSVILEEIAMYRDHPFWVIYEEAMERYFGTHPLSHRVLGTNETITAMQRDAMVEYFEHRYSADNTTVALAGRVDFDAMVERLREHCGHWPRTGAVRAHPPVEHHDVSFTTTSETTTQHYLLMMANAPAMGDDRRYAGAMLAQILGDVEGSRLYWALVETGLAEEAQAQYDGRDGLGDYLMYAVCNPDRADEVEQTIRRACDELVGSLCEDDLERVRSRVLTSATLHSELPAGRMRRLGQQWTYLGKYRSLEEELERMAAITLDDLRTVAADFPIAPRLVARLAPREPGTVNG